MDSYSGQRRTPVRTPSQNVLFQGVKQTSESIDGMSPFDPQSGHRGGGPTSAKPPR